MLEVEIHLNNEKTVSPSPNNHIITHPFLPTLLQTTGYLELTQADYGCTHNNEWNIKMKIELVQNQTGTYLSDMVTFMGLHFRKANMELSLCL